ncbi:MAG: carbohydrate binding family 9 domain-containing protein, partial [Candidatus Aminicenantes bacterium]|nr:carbohydrate binding family 9 domain-containing protein [Candidatus Aminicenantes bacterium]
MSREKVRGRLKLSSLVPLILFGSYFSMGAAGQEDPGKMYRIRALRVENNVIHADGTLNEEAWQRAEAITQLTQRNPNYGQPASEDTMIKVLYDDDSLYVGAVCFHKDIEDIVANKLTHRDVSWEDLFSFVLDTFHDHTKAYCFQTNPLGAREESFMDGPGSGDLNWNEVWDVKTKINRDSWSAEFRIPLRILRFPSRDDQTWGFNIVRLLRKKNESDYWAPIPPQHTVSNLALAGDLTGLYGLKSKRNLQVRPNVLLGETREYEPGQTTRKADLGLDLKYVPSSNFAVDLTVKPDFAQIESDDVQINLTRFSLFYPEKRDFFLENARLFEFGLIQKIQPFFSRRIGIHNGQPVPILFGGRVTGKFARTNVGVVNATTEETEPLPLTNYSVFRLRQDLLMNSYVGFIFTNVQSRDGYNRCWGIDSEFWPAKNTRLKAFYSAVSANGVESQNSAGHFSYYFNTDLWALFLGYNGIGKNYDPAAGFVILRDVKDYSGMIRKSFRPNKHGIRKLDFTGTFDYMFAQAGSSFYRLNMAEFGMELDSGDTAGLAFSNTFEKFDEDFPIYKAISVPAGDYTYNTVQLNYDISQHKRLSGEFEVEYGKFYGGRRTSIFAAGIWKVSKHVSLGGGAEI